MANEPTQGFSAGAVATQVSAILRGEAPPKAAPVVPPAPEKVDMVDELESVLKGESPEVPGDAETLKESLTLEGLAEKLGVKVADLYDVDVPMPDGAETLKLSALKDLATEKRRETTERLEWETQRDQERNQIANDRTELEALLGMVPPEYRTRALLDKAKQQIEMLRQAEAGKLLRRVPEWRDPAQMAADMELIGPHVAGFGFTQEELTQVYDHRLLAYIRHNAKREARIESMLAEARGKREKKGSPVTNGRQPANKTVSGGTTRSSKVSAVSALLRGEL